MRLQIFYLKNNEATYGSLVAFIIHFRSSLQSYLNTAN